MQRVKRFTGLHLPADHWLIVTMIVACIASIGSLLHYFQSHQLLLYLDSNAHISIARRLLDNATPGLAQLGGVWLPLPHLMMFPFAQNEYLWRTGLVGSVISMPCYLITAVFLFLSARRLTRNSSSSFVGSLVFVLNPNILYLQTTALTELLFIATMTAACYYFLAWTQDGQTNQLLIASAVTLLATMARYDGWPLLIAFCVLIPMIGWIRHYPWVKIEANLIVFIALASLGILLWIIWCSVIFGDPLYFQRSRFSAQGNNTSILASGQLFAYHNVEQSFRYYLLSCIEMLGVGLFALSIFSVVVFIVQRRFSAETLAALAFWVPCAYYVVSLFTGQAVIYLPSAMPSNAGYYLWNTRYAAVCIPPAAIFLAVLTSNLMGLVPRSLGSYRAWLHRARQQGYQYGVLTACIAAIGLQSVFITNKGIITLQSGQFGFDCAPPRQITIYLAQYYVEEDKVMKTATSLIDSLEPAVGIPMRNVIYEGNGVLWKKALQDPASEAEWIILNPRNPDDILTRELDINSPQFHARFTPVVIEPRGLTLYHRNGRPLIPIRSVSPELYIENYEHRQCSY